jgi:hypothetical protein
MKKLIVMGALAIASAPGWAVARSRVPRILPKIVEVVITDSQNLRATFESKQGCITTVVDVSAVEQVTRQTPPGSVDRFRAATLTVEQLDDPGNGTDPRTGRVCGTLPDPILQSSSVTVENPDVSFDPALKSGRLKGSARFFDSHGGTFRSMSFDLRWKAQGGITPTTSSDVVELPDRRVRTITVDLERRATASGFVKEGSVNHTPGASRPAGTRIRRGNTTQITELVRSMP